MIVGVGTDIIEIKRVEKALNDKFIKTLFNEEEYRYEDKSLRLESVAGKFAAKESVAKALGTGFRGFSFKDIIILKDDIGKPYVKLMNKAKTIAESYGNYKIHLSISHSKENAIAYAILEVL
ncbi:MAG: holo-ACP synthase [Clostridiaceae bacterium]